MENAWMKEQQQEWKWRQEKQVEQWENWAWRPHTTTCCVMAISVCGAVGQTRWCGSVEEYQEQEETTNLTKLMREQKQTKKKVDRQVLSIRVFDSVARISEAKIENFVKNKVAENN